jgi:alginate O-acetyltransferase complex protein AlgI
VLFNSFAFFAFLAVVYVAYLCLGMPRERRKAQNALLLLASYFFYACWDWRFLGLIGLSTLVDYALANAIATAPDDQKRLRWLHVAIVFNIGVLGVFKYTNFFVGSFVDLMNTLGLRANWNTLRIILPVGISFYTFQSLGYLIDVYRRRVEPVRSLLDCALFISFFPLLVSGPIERATTLLPQLQAPRRLTVDGTLRGCYLILFGLFKKVVVADGLAPSVDAVFAQTTPTSGVQVLAAVYLFCIQIYADFSGYSDIARGVAKLFGIELTKNFLTPYFSASPAEFWTRWHISLSAWVRDYIYTPMAVYFMRKSERRIEEFKPHLYAMTLMGLWHGAAWTYVVWGVFHGSLLIVWSAVRWPKRLRGVRKRVPKALWVLLFFHLTCFAMLIFRADSLAQLVRFSAAVFTNFRGPVAWSGQIAPPPLAALLGGPLLIVLDSLAFWHASERFYEKWPRPLRAGMYALLALLLAMGGANEPAKFIYIQF